MIDAGGGLLRGGADRRHERQQMVLARVGRSRGRRAFPADQPLEPLPGRRGQRFLQPCVERAQGSAAPAPKRRRLW